jgi:hypothetical protein
MVKDPIIELGKGNTTLPGVDLGLILTRPATTSNVGIIFDESESTLEIGYTQGNASDSTITMQSAATEPLSVNVNGTISGNGSGLTALNATNITTGTLDRNTTGSAATLTTPRSIGGVNFDGSADIVPTTFGAATFDTDTLVIDSVNNRVGIGTTSPQAPLHIGDYTSGSAGELLRLSGASSADRHFKFLNEDDGVIGGAGANAIWVHDINSSFGQYAFRTNNNELMRITNSGNVGIGTTDPKIKLHLYDTTTEPTIAIQHLTSNENNTSTNVLGNLCLHRSHRSGIGNQVGIRSIRRANTWDDQADMEFYVRNGGYGEQTAMVVNSGSSLNSAKIGIGTTSPSTELQIGNTSTKTSDTYLTIASDGGNAYAQGIRLIHHGTDDSNMFGWRIRGDDTDDCFHINYINGGSHQTSALTIKNNGIVTTPSRPAFYAWDNSTSRSGTTLTFDSTTYNIGSHYNTSTSRFKTPVAGTYIFAAVLAHDTANEFGDAYFSFYVDGVLRRDILEGMPIHDSHYETHAVYIVNLSANQYVDIRSRSNTNITFINGNHGAYYRNCFQGALLG